MVGPSIVSAIEIGFIEKPVVNISGRITRSTVEGNFDICRSKYFKFAAGFSHTILD
jgi:hypothetical protein